MTETGSDVVERLRVRLEDAAGDVVSVDRSEIEAVLAVVEAAQEYENASLVGPPFSTSRALRIRRARERLSKTLAALHSQASDEGRDE